MSVAATRDDLASVVTALTNAAVLQRKWQAGYEANASASRAAAGDTEDELERARHRSVMALYERFAAQARGTAHGFEVSADMIRRYVSVPGE
jgi:hypothetical protein